MDDQFTSTVPATPGLYALCVLFMALQSGQSSRLYQKLVRDQEMVTSVGGLTRKTGDPAPYTQRLGWRPTTRTDAVEVAIYEEIERLKTTPIADWEPQQRARRGARFSRTHSDRCRV